MSAQRVGEALSRHIEHFRDDDFIDRSALNCACGKRFPPREIISGVKIKYRDWSAYYTHLGEVAIAAMG